MSLKRSALVTCLLVSAIVTDISTVSATGVRAATAGSTIGLCAPTTATTHQMREERRIVSRRVHHGFHFLQAKVTAAANCIDVALPHPLKWIRWLADDIASVGRFGIGIAYPDKTKALTPGESVRYKNDPVTAENQNLPDVKVEIGRPAFIGFSARLISQSGYEYVGVNLTTKAAQTLCRFTQRMINGLAVVVLDRQVITDEQVSVSICAGRLLTGFPKTKTLDKPLGPRELLADLHSGPPLHLPLTVTSIS